MSDDYIGYTSKDNTTPSIPIFDMWRVIFDLLAKDNYHLPCLFTVSKLIKRLAYTSFINSIRTIADHPLAERYILFISKEEYINKTLVGIKRAALCSEIKTKYSNTPEFYHEAFEARDTEDEIMDYDDFYLDETAFQPDEDQKSDEPTSYYRNDSNLIPSYEGWYYLGHPKIK